MKSKREAYQELVDMGELNPTKERVKDWCNRRNMIMVLNEQGFNGETIIHNNFGEWK